ncbi:unnamed protein product [Schistosoma mattheei]|uniref:Uncharacterized protein n=1 Tax=Schistosoma mattheei TaxID=31246 RepID=A0A183PYQ4_9TREM|nr:unnamed protein product [Schistosoma mattheei]
MYIHDKECDRNTVKTDDNLQANSTVVVADSMVQKKKNLVKCMETLDDSSMTLKKVR